MKQAVPLALTKLAFTTITTSGVLLRAKILTEPALLKVLLKNDTDKTCQFSFDGGNTYSFELLSGDGIILDDVKISGDIWVKAISANATSGNALVTPFVEG